MKKHKSLYALLVLLGGFLGGMATRLVEPRTLHATNTLEDVVRAREFQLVDASGQRVATLGFSGENSPALWFFDKDNNARFNAGLYGDGQPFIALLLPSGSAKGLFRLAGPANAPVVVLKNSGKDRIILGMDLQTGNQGGLMYIDEKGNRKDVFGNFKY